MFEDEVTEGCFHLADSTLLPVSGSLRPPPLRSGAPGSPGGLGLVVLAAVTDDCETCEIRDVAKGKDGGVQGRPGGASCRCDKVLSSDKRWESSSGEVQ